MARGPRKSPRRDRRVLNWLVWFAFLNLVWLLLISAWITEEAILGLVASAIAATAAEAVREQGIAGFRFRLEWLWEARVLPWRTVRETGVVLKAMARQLTGRRTIQGRFRVLPVSLPDDPAEEAAKRALLTAGLSFAPNSYVLAIDNRENVMLVHELVEEEAE